MAIIKNNFKDDENKIGNKRDGRANFAIYMREEGAWFVSLLEEVVDKWISQGYPISEILIKERMPVEVYINKASVVLEVENRALSESLSSITGEMIAQIKESLVQKSIVELSKKEDSIDNVVNFSFSVMGLGIFRANYSKDASGIGMTLRYHSYQLPELEDMGYPKFYTEFIKELVSETAIATPFGTKQASIVKKTGLILHVGPTGAGKTTSMASEISFLAKNTSGSFILYDRPKEIDYRELSASIRQYEIGIDILPESIESHAIRNNPTVIQYGEARNKEEMNLVVNFGNRGHLVFSTMHATNVEEALNTLISTVSEDSLQMLSNTLQAIVAHNLTTTQSGAVIPLYEIIILNASQRKLLSEKKVKLIMDGIRGTKEENKKAITFTDSITKAREDGKIDAREAQALKESFDKRA